MPKVYEQLMGIRQKLEKHYKEMQDIEFTVQDGTLYMLQTRTGKRTGTAAVRIAVEMVKERLIDETTAVKRVNPDSLNHLLLPQLDPKAEGRSRSPGASPPAPARPPARWSCRPRPRSSIAEKHPDEPILLVRKETSPEDVAGMHLAKGILTATGGKASHAAVVARGWGKPCVVGCEAIKIDEAKGQITHRRPDRQGRRLRDDQRHDRRRDDRQGADRRPDDDRRLRHADGAGPTRPRKLKVRTNADTPADAAKAREFGAEGIGLCRTEHMFFGRTSGSSPCAKMILADDEEGRKKALAEARAVPEGGLRRHLRGDGRPAGHHPPARPAAARVPAARRAGPGRGRPAARHPRREGQASGSRSCTSSTR